MGPSNLDELGSEVLDGSVPPPQEKSFPLYWLAAWSWGSLPPELPLAHWCWSTSDI